MELSYIIGIVTIIVTYILGELAKKYEFINKNKIPLQNLIVGFLAFGINYLITKDVNVALIFSGLTAGGIYDLKNNLLKLKKGE